jgi:hypothetical protein
VPGDGGPARPRAVDHLAAARGDCLALAGAVLASVVQEFAVARLARHGSEASARGWLIFATTFVLVFAALRFRRFVGAWLVIAGLVLNLAAMAPHGGLMPVSLDHVRQSGLFPSITADDVGRQLPNSKDVVLERRQVRFYVLSDRHQLTLPWYGPNIYSLGDFVLFGGVALAALQALLGLAGREPLARPSRIPPAGAGRAGPVASDPTLLADGLRETAR